jgi:hypothetical protein
VLFVHPATAEDGEEVLGSLWPEARAIADPDRALHGAFGLVEGTIGQILGPRALLAGVRAVLKGNGVGKPRGSVRALPGAFLVRDGEVVRRHVASHAGDRPDWNRFVSHPDGSPEDPS